MLNCSFYNNFGRFFSSIYSELYFINSSILDFECDKFLALGCIFNFVKKGNLKLENSSLIRINGINKALLIYMIESKATINSCLFNNIYSSSNNLGINIFEYSDVLFQNSISLNFSNYFFDMLNSSLTVKSSNFNNSDNLNNIFSSIIRIINCKSIEIFNSSFHKNLGGFLSINNENLLKSDNFIINCNFTQGISKKFGGAIYVLNSNVNLSNCLFFNNSALIGGAIYFEVYFEKSNIFLTLNNTLFISNRAINGGGAIFWVKSVPIMIKTYLNDSFINNNAEYGKNIATRPMRIYSKCFYFQNKNLIEEFNTEKNNNFFIIKNEVSGSPNFHFFQLRFVDYYNQTVNNLEHIESIFLRSDHNDKNKDNAILIGPNFYKVQNGEFTINQFIIISNPNSLVYLTIISSLIGSMSGLFSINPNYEKDFEGNYMYSIPIQIRECILGEIYIKNVNICKKCNPGSFSFNPNEADCKTCPKEALCLGGNNFEILDGFWRSNNMSVIIYNCFESQDNCIGGEISFCLNNFYGPLCRTCEVGYFKVNSISCLECQQGVINILRIIGIILVVCLVIYFVIKSSIDNNKLFKKIIATKRDSIIKKPIFSSLNMHSLYFKIIINYSQMITLLGEISLERPYFINKFLNLGQYFSSFLLKFVGFECVLNQKEIYYLEPYLKFISISLFPLGLILVSFLFWTILKYLKKINGIFDKLNPTIIGIYFMIQPDILNECVKMLICIEIEEKYYLKYEPFFSCETDYHIKIVNFYVWPVFIIWSFLIPFVLFMILYFNKKKLFIAKIFKNFGFLYIGYKNNCFYWDILIIFRKSICVLALKVNNNLKMFHYIVIISIYFYYFKKSKPFCTKILNKLDELTSITILISFYLTLFCLFSNGENNGNEIIFMIILTCNILYITYYCYSLKQYIKLLYVKYKSKFFSFLKSIKSLNKNKIRLSIGMKSVFLKFHK